ncbi:MAG: methylmalonyl-CoA epimerase [Caldisericia bacterium]|nr:methylmalonyl-CoA epimerase [Caldisericia bacterium]
MFGLSHIGIAVTNLEESKKAWQDIGFVLDHESVVPEQKVKVAKLKWHETVIELLEPTSDDSPVKAFIDKKGPGIHHLAIECDDVSGKIAELLGKNIAMIDKVARIGAAGKPIAFVHPKSTGGVLLELEQE